VTAIPFNDGWEIARAGEEVWSPVHLPHDAMIGELRRADAPAWAHGAYFPGGEYTYRTYWAAPSDVAGKEVLLRFEGVYRHSRVLIDGIDVGGALSGYIEFEVRLDPYVQAGSTHLLEVTVDNSKTPNSRWYTGSGIYRPVWLEIRDAIHIERDGTAEAVIVASANP
jgi:beta-galactosidase